MPESKKIPNPGSDKAEIFIDIPGWEELYQVSNFGRVKSLRYYGCKGKSGFLSPRLTNITARSKQRYASVRLTNKSRKLDKQYRIHRLVAQCFIPNPENKPEVNHKDGDGLNNHVNNLEWVTSSENQKHAFNNGLCPMPTRLNKGQRYCWENKDGRLFHGTVSMLYRAFPEDNLDIAYLHQIINQQHGYHSFKGWTVIPTPNPGSDKAIQLGGTCPVLDNAHGRGAWGTEGNKAVFWITEGCPLHTNVDSKVEKE